MYPHGFVGFGKELQGFGMAPGELECPGLTAEECLHILVRRPCLLVRVNIPNSHDLGHIHRSAQELLIRSSARERCNVASIALYWRDWMLAGRLELSDQLHSCSYQLKSSVRELYSSQYRF